MDRDRLLGPGSTEDLRSGESFVEEHDRRWGPFGAVGGGLLAILLWKPAMALIAGTGPLAPPADAAPIPTLELALEEAAADLRKRLPQNVDEVTTLTAVTVEGRRFVYHLGVSADIPTAQIAAALAEIQAGNSAEICAQAATRDAVRQGAVLVHRYTDGSGDRFETEVSTCSA
jgi:hypothetical protein